VPIISSCPGSRVTRENRLRVLYEAVTLGASMKMERRPGFGLCTHIWKEFANDKRARVSRIEGTRKTGRLTLMNGKGWSRR
jgi:hypothetical protein